MRVHDVIRWPLWMACDRSWTAAMNNCGIAGAFYCEYIAEARRNELFVQYRGEKI
jgi:hypothetical protein